MRQGARLENTIPWGFKLPEVESGVRLRPPLEDSLDALMERTAVIPKPTMIPPPSVPPPPRPMPSSIPPPAAMIVPPSAPPPAMMHPSLIPAVQALTVATACGWIVPPSSSAPLPPPMPVHSGFGWRLYVLLTTGLMAALATAVFFLTGHASAHVPAVSAPPVITVNVPPPLPAAAPPVVAPSASAAPKAPVHVPAPRPAPSSSAKPIASSAAAPSATPPPTPPTPAPPSTQAQETADMLREQLGAAVH